MSPQATLHIKEKGEVNKIQKTFPRLRANKSSFLFG